MLARDIILASSVHWCPCQRCRYLVMLLLNRVKLARIFCHYLGRKSHTVGLEITLGFWVCLHLIIDLGLTNCLLKIYFLSSTPLWSFVVMLYIVCYLILLGSIFQAILILNSESEQSGSLVFSHFVSPENLDIHSLPLLNLLSNKLRSPGP